MSVTNPAASRLLCRSLAAAPAKTSSHAAVASCSSAAAASRAASSSSSASSHQQQRQRQRQQQRSQFHTCAALAGRRRSAFPNVKRDSPLLNGGVQPESDKKATGVMGKYKKNVSPEYDDTDIETLKKIYTPEQLDAILLGEKANRGKDFVVQGRMRTDPYRFRYVEDFATVRPVVDKRPKNGRPVDPSARFMTPDEFGDDLLDHYREGSEGEEKPFGVDVDKALDMYEDMRSRLLNKEPGEELTEDELFQSVDKVLGPVSADSVNVQKALKNLENEHEDKELTEEEFKAEVEKDRQEDLEFYKYMMERNSLTGFDGGDTALAPDVPDKVPGVAGLYKQQVTQQEEDLDPEGKYSELKHQTGMSVGKIIQMHTANTKALVTRWVSNQTRLGKIRSTYILAVAGNNDGWLGLGEAKSVDPIVADSKAKLIAIRNMRPIRRYENRTIYGNVEGKSGATVVQLYSRPPGFGLRVSHRFFEMARLAGLQDLAAKMPRSRNPMNSVKACYQALTNQPDPEIMAIGRGKKLVDVRKVYHGGAVY